MGAARATEFGGADVVDTTACDREPIHIPGSIQPHGALLSLHEPSLVIAQASANMRDFLGKDARGLLGRSLGSLLDTSSARRLSRVLGRPSLRAECPVPLRIGGHGFDVALHRSGGLLVLELEPCTCDEAAYGQAQSVLDRMQGATSLETLLSMAAEQIKLLTGYDRVMVYRFHPDLHGEVVAEARAPELSPYLDLHYPASDIPSQARALYELNWTRLIRDIDYRPAVLVPSDNPLTGTPLDLSLSTLRSVSPVHIQYLRNMGVRATLTISLLQSERLAGLIACHHRTPRHLSLRLRRACELIGRVLSLQLEVRERQEEAEHRLGAGLITSRLVERASNAEDLGKGLLHGTPSLLDLVPAGGVALIDDSRLCAMGSTPPAEAIRAVAEWLRGHMEGSLFAADCLSDHLAWTSAISDTSAGLLAIALSRGEGLFALWFRPELVRTVAWGGDPSQPAAINPQTRRLEPRASFEIWKQEVRGRARPWAAWEIAAAEDMRGAVVGIVLRRAAELARLHVELKEAVRARDDFLSVASHELRTPIATLKLSLQALVRAAQRHPDRFTPAWARPRLDTALRQIERTGQLVDHLLDISRITSGRLLLHLTDVDMAEVTHQAVARFEDELEETGSTLSIELEKGVVGRWDASRLDQVVTNLVSNALKYGAGKPIAVAVAREGDEAVLRVRDQGIGIAPGAQARIFERFERAVSAGHNVGFGLGLWIVRQLVEQMGGTVSVLSVEGQGSTFEVRLPVAKRRGPPAGGSPVRAGERRDEGG